MGKKVVAFVCWSNRYGEITRRGRFHQTDGNDRTVCGLRATDYFKAVHYEGDPGVTCQKCLRAPLLQRQVAHANSYRCANEDTSP